MDRRRHPIPAALAVLAIAAPAAIAALPGGAKYVGTTSDGSVVAVKLSGDAKQVKRLRIHYRVKCSDGGTAQTYTDVLGPRVPTDPPFSPPGAYRGSSDDSKNTSRLWGKPSASRAHAKFSLTSTVKGG